MSALYSLRPELEFSSQTHQGRSFVVVKDPVTNRYLRFTEGQAAILELLHSPIDVDSLASAAADRLHTPVKHESVEGSLRSLDEKLLLGNAETRKRATSWTIAMRAPSRRKTFSTCACSR